MTGLNFDDIYNKYLEVGFAQVLDLARQRLPPHQRSSTLSADLDLSAQTTLGSSANGDNHVASPLPYEYTPTQLGWPTARTRVVAGPSPSSSTLATSHGMEGQGGLGFLRLSSGTAFITALERLTPSSSTHNAFQADASTSSSDNKRMFRPTESSSEGPARRPAQPLPPLSEILPFVNCYFEYFRLL